MKNRHSLLEVGGILFISGLSMILFPSIYEKSVTQHYSYPENIYMGIILMIVGSFLLLIKYYNIRKRKIDNKKK